MEKQAQRLAAGMDRPPIIVSPYDAELYGHWVYEGPIFLSDLYRQLHFDQSIIQPITPSEYWTGIRPTSWPPGRVVLGLKVTASSG